MYVVYSDDKESGLKIISHIAYVLVGYAFCVICLKVAKLKDKEE